MCCQDDICIGSKNEIELKEENWNCVERIKKFWKENEQKTKNINENPFISFLGYSISKEGMSPDQVLIETMLKVLVPKNKNWSTFWD